MTKTDREPSVRSRLFLIFLLLISTTISAETYRWVNEDGVVTYSQTPPPDAESEVVKTYSAPSSDAAAAKQRLQKLRQDLADREEDRTLKKAEQQEQKKDQEMRKNNCEAARKNLQTLTNLGLGMYKVGDKYLRLTEEQRQQRMQEAKDQIKEYCKR
jgi:exonuclease VII large subunit